MQSSSDHHAVEVYEELRAAAARRLAGGHTLQPTELVHEVYLRLRDRDWQGRTHFRAVAAMAMRQVIIDRVRSKGAARHGGGQVAVSLSGLGEEVREERLIALDEALARLAALDARKAKVVELRVFGGMEIVEIAEALACSPATVKRDWRTARAWLASSLAP